ncbi:ABC transporter substrate-binding protein [Virgibacillus ihumii]|uniref:ABC transporter substrate-binding protein n=1 Tax=Virgibacillus ihumii TaxID=2686091 RepID=UPI00157D51CF|nr:ABC transporter substrate-binding protein [Virgibacillus ihumii]
MKRKLILFVSLLIILSTILIGCNGQSQSEGKSSNGKVTLDLWHYWTDNLESTLKKYVEEFNKTHSKIDIELTYVPYSELTQQLLIGATGGDLPDLIIGGINEVQFYAKSGILEDISEKVKNSGEAESMYENIIEIHKVDGKFYGLPLHTNAVALFYNTDLIKEPPTNWGELTQMAQELTTENRYGFAASAHNSQHGTASWIPFLWSTGSDVGDLESSEAISALKLWENMYEKNLMSKEVVNEELQDINVDFYTGKAAMMIGGSWMIPVINAEAPDLNWSVAKIPKDKEYSSVIGGESIAIGKGQNVEESWKFIEFMLEPERQMEWLKATGNYPSGSKIANKPYFQENNVRKTFAEVIKTSQGYGWGQNHNEINTAIYTAIQDALVGGATAKEALKKASNTITPILEEN